jgi:hypothetical protein
MMLAATKLVSATVFEKNRTGHHVDAGSRGIHGVIAIPASGAMKIRRLRLNVAHGNHLLYCRRMRRCSIVAEKNLQNRDKCHGFYNLATNKNGAP